MQICFLGEKHIYFHPTTNDVMINDWLPFFIVDRIVDLLFCFDIFINFRSAYVGSPLPGFSRAPDLPVCFSLPFPLFSLP